MSLRRQIIEEKKLKKTKAGLLLLPMLSHIGMNKQNIGSLKTRADYSTSYIETYVDEIDIDNEVNVPVLVNVFENVDDDDLAFVMYKLSNDFTFIKNGMIDGELVCYNKIPDDLVFDYYKFKEGKYTQFSSEYKEILVCCYGRVTGVGSMKDGFPALTVYDRIYPDDTFEGERNGKSKKEEYVEYMNKLGFILKEKDIKEFSQFDTVKMEEEQFLPLNQFKNKHIKESV